jgi:predicted nucleic acid-binding protein
VTGEVFIDSGIFIAFLNRSDRYHRFALSLFSQPPPRWSTSALVVAETYSWLLHRSGEEAARRLRLLVPSLRDLALLPADALHQEQIWKKLDRFRGYKLTSVDASSLIWLEERRVRTVWGTDNDLAIEGATVVPGPP